ncbi:GNAT family N-acetyltransferase [Paraburkholderia diazotrophica]|uniref:Predicted acetyltransferase, GNAT family n=1 Tax=Paraburkholderia diazotrophica TaxID=667676 RepID=A0A1H7E8V7_9BURK|nr:GNAT family N-acetyltransferase [Paraburkholderia diazotrophica]SEK10054.1 Predicted acetyltransferase, GNAT family [Paraburkholderia diazotrophica]
MSEAEAKRKASGIHPLDDVVWNALVATHKRFALGDGGAIRYPSDVAPYAATADSSAESFAALRSLVEAQGPVTLVTTDDIVPPPGFSVIRRAVLLQMIWQGRLDRQDEFQHVRLAVADVPEMLALTAATRPGPFGPRTIELGSYFGVRTQDELVAMAGERMTLDGFTEISAVCVDEAFRGRGHAAGLMKLLISTITARGETPFLHVFTSNRTAISLYRTLGFVDRREMHLTGLDRAQS